MSAQTICARRTPELRRSRLITTMTLATMMLCSAIYAVADEEATIVVDANAMPSLTPYSAHYTKIQDAINPKFHKRSAQILR